jgi:outer membrane protein assembly factor BamB
MVMESDDAVVTTRGGKVFRIDLANGRLRDSVRLSGRKAVRPPICLSDGGIVFYTEPGAVVRLDDRLQPIFAAENDGWQLALAGPGPEGSLVAAGLGDIYLIDLESGVERWHRDYRGNDGRRVAIHENGNIAVGSFSEYSVSWDSEYYDFFLTMFAPDGSKSYVFSSEHGGGSGSCDVICLPDGSTLFSYLDRIGAFNPSGREVWSVDIGGALEKPFESWWVSAPAFLPSGAILLTTAGGHVAALPPSGPFAWIVKPLGDEQLLDPVIDANGMCFVASESGGLAALDRAGVISFSLHIGSRITGIAVGPARSLLVTTADGEIVIVE